MYFFSILNSQNKIFPLIEEFIMTIYSTKTVIITAIIIFAAVAALTMYNSSKSKSDYERDMDDQEQIEYLRSVSRKKTATK